jgi:3-isopropylmalate/(R)-2-methylmalate dehydratase small subunit
MNIGLPLLECPEAVEGTDSGDLVEVELATGEIRNLTRKKGYQAKPYPEFMLELMNSGGLIEYTRRRLESRRTG